MAWMPISRRSATLASRLAGRLVLVPRAGFRRPWSAPFAYPVQALRTIAAIVRHRPRSAIIIAPPVFAPLVAWPLLRMLGATWAIDIHSGALLDRRWAWSRPLLEWLCRRASCGVVTLESLASPLRDHGAVVVVLPDPIPEFAFEGVGPDPAESGRPPTVVAICGWGDDEPIEALVAAAVDRPWRLVVTGRPRRAIDAPHNVAFAGFLRDEAFVSTIAAADVLVVLTTRDDTLLSGAWEALAVQRPLVMSGTDALRSTFGEGPIYVGDDADDIARGVEQALRDPDAAAAVARLATRFRNSTEAALLRLASRLGAPVPPPA